MANVTRHVARLTRNLTSLVQSNRLTFRHGFRLLIIYNIVLSDNLKTFPTFYRCDQDVVAGVVLV